MLLWFVWFIKGFKNEHIDAPSQYCLTRLAMVMDKRQRTYTNRVLPVAFSFLKTRDGSTVVIPSRWPIGLTDPEFTIRKRTLDALHMIESL
jgi:hypothetical protein